MTSRRHLALLTGLLVAACGGDAAESAGGGAEQAPAASTAAADEAALHGLADYYVTHYNMHHASMVADLFQDEDSGFLAADGAVLMGKAEILANLEAEMAGSPTVSIDPDDFMVFGDDAVGRGTYSVETTPPGAQPMSMSGSWIASYTRQADGAWKLGWVTTNFDHAWPEGMPATPGPDEEPVEEGTLGDLIGAYETHWNLGHPSMVGDLYTEDAWAAFPGFGAASGRTAINTVLDERINANPVDIDIHDVGTYDLGDGWAIDGGWYVMTPKGGGDPVQGGSYMGLARQGEDGQWKLHWIVSNAQPAAAMPM